MIENIRLTPTQALELAQDAQVLRGTLIQNLGYDFLMKN